MAKVKKGVLKPKLDNSTKEKPHESAGAEELTLEPPTEPAPVAFTALFRYATRFELFLDFIGLIAAAAAGAAMPLISLFVGNVVDSFVHFEASVSDNNRNFSNPAVIRAGNSLKDKVPTDAAAFVYIGAGILVATNVYMIIWVCNGEALAKRVREDYLKAVLRQDIAFFDKVGAGEIATRIQNDAHLIQQGTSEKVALVIGYLSGFFTGFIIAYVRSWRLALAISSILPCIIIAGGIMDKFMQKYQQLTQDRLASGGTLAEEVISTIRTAHAFGTQSIFSSLYDTHAAEAFIYESKSAVAFGIVIGVFFFIIWAAYALGFSFGATLIIRGEATVGNIVNVLLAIVMGSFSLAMMTPETQAMSRARGAAARIWETIDRVPTIDSASPDGLKPETVTGHIELEDVKFHYPSRPDVPVLKGLSLTFEAGKTVALVGASGSGKSTIVSLVERFYDPVSGAIKLDGRDLKSLNVKWLRNQIGLVSQEPTLFAASIRENVAQGLIGTHWEKAPEDEKFRMVKDACVQANADGFIRKLPNGYDSLVGERGFLLSGGQKQRIAIARAIVSDPRILLLDEATSALDTQSEGIVQSALDKASTGRTTIAIAHRLSTIKDADQIYVMDKGVVVESGTHDKLLSQEGPYARLVQAQKLREVEEISGDFETSRHLSDQTGGNAIQQEANDTFSLSSREGATLKLTEKIQIEDSQEEGRRRSLFTVLISMGIINHEAWWTYTLGSLSAILAGMVYPIAGIIYGSAIAAFQSSDHHTLRVRSNRNALYFFIISIVSFLSMGAQNCLFGTAVARLSYTLRSKAFKAIIRQDMKFFDEQRNSAGALTANLSGNVEKINGLAGVTLGTIVQSMATLIGGAIVGLCYSWRIALVGIACIPFVISTGFIRLHVIYLKDKKNKAAHESSAQLACEATAAIRTVASLTREEECVALYSENLESTLRHSNRTAIWSTMLFAFTQAMPFFVMGLIFWYGSTLLIVGKVTSGDFFVCFMAIIFASIQVGDAFSYVPDISSAHSAANDLLNSFDSIPAIDAESKDGKIFHDVEGDIRLDDVHFHYPTRPGVSVLRGLNIEVKSGTYVALVGESGCGKSTVIQLIERFYDPVAGQVCLDGQDISTLNVQEYRKHVALVSQEPTLYAGTIRFNILLGAIKPFEEVTQEEIESVCRDANILDFIQSLPDGLSTQVGSRGSQLSGGQKQRIAIARALLRNPKVLLLDEATSALDSQSEKVVQDALDKAAKGRTTIAIAHRLSTIQNADLIYFIKEGRVSEAGTHAELISSKGGYSEYVQLQALNRN